MTVGDAPATTLTAVAEEAERIRTFGASVEALRRTQIQEREAQQDDDDDLKAAKNRLLKAKATLKQLEET